MQAGLEVCSELVQQTGGPPVRVKWQLPHNGLASGPRDSGGVRSKEGMQTAAIGGTALVESKPPHHDESAGEGMQLAATSGDRSPSLPLATQQRKWCAFRVVQNGYQRIGGG